MTDNTSASNSAATLLSSIETIESVNAEVDELKERIKDEMSAVKGMGFDPKIVREILKRRKQDPDAVAEKDSLIATYEQALEDANNARRTDDQKGKNF